MTKDKILTLKEILSNEPRVLVIPGIGKVKIRDPTVKDRIDAEVLASKHPRWKEMDKEERTALVTKMVTLKMLIEPKITYEDYLKSNDSTLLAILDTIAMDYALRIRKLSEKRSKMIKDFLSVMREDYLKSSTIS